MFAPSALLAPILELSPIGIDWWIILGGWVPGFLGMAIALAIWLRSRGKSDE